MGNYSHFLRHLGVIKKFINFVFCKNNYLHLETSEKFIHLLVPNHPLDPLMLQFIPCFGPTLEIATLEFFSAAQK